MRRALWAVPVVVFLATFGVFGVRHPGSVKAMLMNGSGLLMIGAAIVTAAIFTWASQFRPKIQPFVPLVITMGILGAAVYAEVPFERASTQNKTLVAEEITEDTTASTVQPMAVRHATGDLHGINHTASGTVSAVESSTGDWVLRFEGFTVQGAPTPVLYAIDGRDARDPGGTNLGPFTATEGDLLDIALPKDTKPVAGWTVLIWCDKFDTPIANATLR